MRVVCMGDSLTYGYGVARAAVWTALLSDAWPQMSVINRGISGDTTGGMMARLERDVVEEQPDFAILMGGSNDSFLGRDLKGAKCGISGMVFQCLANKIKVGLGVPFPVVQEGIDDRWKPYAGGEKVQELLKEYRQWLLEFGESFSIEILDFWKVLSERKETIGRYYLDGIHLNPLGHRLIGEYLIKRFSVKYSNMLQ